MIKCSRKRDIIVGMYISAAIVMILTRPVSVVATMIDGIITSRFYGEEAYPPYRSSHLMNVFGTNEVILEL